jgi:hypothetical protein
MCVIIDANVAPRVLLSNNDPDFRAVFKALFSDRRPIAKVVYGGKNATELQHNGAIRRILAELDRAGRASEVSNSDIEIELAQVEMSGLCVSDDPHIIALARAGNVRLVCTKDKDLQRDVTNKQLLDKPRGRVYQYASHRTLLVRFCT